MIQIKKNFVYITAIALIAVVITVGTIAIFNISMNNKNQAQVQSDSNATIKAAGEKLMVDSASANTAAKAKELLLQARQKYVKINDQDRIQAVDAMILMIDNTPASTSTEVTPTTK